MIMPSEPELSFGDISLLCKPFSPPKVVLRNPMKLWQIESNRTHNYLIYYESLNTIKFATQNGKLRIPPHYQSIAKASNIPVSSDEKSSLPKNPQSPASKVQFPDALSFHKLHTQSQMLLRQQNRTQNRSPGCKMNLRRYTTERHDHYRRSSGIDHKPIAARNTAATKPAGCSSDSAYR